MSTNNSNSTNHRTGSEQSYRGNRYRRQQGGRPYQQRRHSNPRTSASQNSRVAVDSRVAAANRSPSNAVDSRVAVASHSPSNVNGDQNSLSPNDSTCFICAEPIQYLAVSECNHKYCHLCSLRLRALYKNKNCAYCKVIINLFIPCKTSFHKNHHYFLFKESLHRVIALTQNERVHS